MSDLKKILNSLGIERAEFSRIIGVNYRTIQRWIVGGYPKHIKELLQAWVRLHSCGIAYRENSINIEIIRKGLIVAIEPEEIKRRIMRGLK